MTLAFMRPRPQLGIVRFAATQSTEAESVHPRAGKRRNHQENLSSGQVPSVAKSLNGRR
jgi:hypothetical protein